MVCAFVNTVDLCKHYHDNRRVGCEAAGVYCGLCVLFRQLDVEDYVDVFSTVRKLRKQRPAIFTSKVQIYAVIRACQRFCKIICNTCPRICFIGSLQIHVHGTGITSEGTIATIYHVFSLAHLLCSKFYTSCYINYIFVHISVTNDIHKYLNLTTIIVMTSPISAHFMYICVLPPSCELVEEKRARQRIQPVADTDKTATLVAILHFKQVLVECAVETRTYLSCSDQWVFDCMAQFCCS